MKKSLKKLLCAALSVAMAAGTVVLPAATASAADPTGTITVDGTNVTVHATTKAVAIVAKYSGGVLVSATSTDVPADTDTPVTATYGDRVFLWDGLGTMKPLAEPEDVPEEVPLETWKFDFGASTSADVADGWIPVTPNDAYAANAGKQVDGRTVQYGFLGTDGHGDAYGQHVDGVVTKAGQNVTLKAGDKTTIATAADDYIGVDTEAKYKIAGDYPIRFSMKAVNDNYYRVKAKLTTFDQTAPATATLFSERHHAIILEEPIAAGEEKEVEFTTTIQKVDLKASGIYDDDMLNVVVVGNNVAVESIVIDRINPLPTIWMYDDSTGCDYQMAQPYFPLQNYGGTGSFLSKYLPKDIVAVNQGEGGLSAIDNMHWNAAKDHIGAGDYVYVQYGHNHKNDASYGAGTYGYLSSIPKYYEYAHEVGANTIFVGPIDRHNWALTDKGAEQQYHVTPDANGKHWTATLAGFSKAAKYYTEILITAGKTKADQFIEKARTDSLATEGAWESRDPDGDGVYTDTPISVVQATYDWADEVIAAGIAEGCVNGVKDVAFVDLNQPTIDWLEEITNDIQAKRTAAGQTFEGVNIGSATDYYFYCQNGGSVDGTHCNDAGADNTASFFFTEAKKTIAKTDAISKIEADVLRPLVTGMRTSDENGYVVSDDIILAGKAPNSKWPKVYVPSSLPELPIVIKDVTFKADGTLESVKYVKQDAEKNMGSYGVIDVEIFNADKESQGHIYSGQIENEDDAGEYTYTAGTGTALFRYEPSTVKLEEGYTYTAIMRKAVDSAEEGVVVDRADPDEYSALYEPTDIEEEYANFNFEYYGKAVGSSIMTYGEDKSDLDSADTWGFVGSSPRAITYNGEEITAIVTQHDDTINKNYIEIKAGGTTSKSYHLWKSFNLKPSPGVVPGGKYLYQADFNLQSVTNPLAVWLADGVNDKARNGTENLMLFTINSGGKINVGDTSGESAVVAGSLVDDEWVTVKAIIDTDLGTLSVSVGGGPAKTIDLAGYKATSLEDVKPTKLTTVLFSNNGTYDVKVTDIIVAKLKRDKLPQYTVTVSSGDNSMGSAAITSENGNPATADLDIASNVTLTATPETGNIFTGWSDGKNVVSTDNPYTFRLQDNTTLTAQFAVQKGVNDVTSFKLSGDKALVKAGTEQKITIQPTDVKDADGNPVAYEASDVAWESDDSGVTVTGGVVTVPAAYEIAANTNKDIHITATINSIPVTYTLTVYSYTFFENFNDGSIKDWTGETSRVTVETGDAIYGNYLKYSLGSQNTRNIHLGFPSAAQLTADYILEFDTAIKVGDTENTDIVIYEGTPTFEWQRVTSSSVFKLSTVDTSTDYTINGDTTDKFTIANSTWVHIYLRTHMTGATKTVDVKITNASTNATIKEKNGITLSGTGIPTGISLQAGRYNSVMQLDNLKIYPAPTN